MAGPTAPAGRRRRSAQAGRCEPGVLATALGWHLAPRRGRPAGRPAGRSAAPPPAESLSDEGLFGRGAGSGGSRLCYISAHASGSTRPPPAGFWRPAERYRGGDARQETRPFDQAAEDLRSPQEEGHEQGSSGAHLERAGQKEQLDKRARRTPIIYGCTRSSSSPSAASPADASISPPRSEEHTSELQSQSNLVCRLLLEKKNIAV